MNYTIKNHPTAYKGTMFRSRLEARWAVFFDMIGWRWWYEPLDYEGWTPDFRVEFPCGHSECSGTHSLLVEIKPYFDISEFKRHPAYEKRFCFEQNAPACFGATPDVVEWEMAHGAGGGIETDIRPWIRSDYHGILDELWNAAGNTVQYHA